MRNADTRTHVLQTALEILERQGSRFLTIDGVAKAAGVSRGGVLYHFPSKAEMIEAMVRFHTEVLEADLEARIAQAEPGPGRVLRAWLDLHNGRPETAPEQQIDLMSFIGRDPRLRAIMDEHRLAQLDRLRSDGLDPDLALLLAMAAEGLFFGPGVDPAAKDRLIALIRRLSWPGPADAALFG
jgi:AcrR family transcriptional regulator